MSDSESEIIEARTAGDLVRRLAEGDTAAEADLVTRYSRGVRLLLQRLVDDAELARDLHQDVFRLALERLRTRGIEEPERLAGWLAGVARKLALGEVRKRARRQTYTGVLDEDPRVVADQESQLQLLERAEQVALVRRLIDDLPNPRDRELLYRYYVGGEEKHALCMRFNLTAEHFHRVLYRARQRFKALYEARLSEPQYEVAAT